MTGDDDRYLVVDGRRWRRTDPSVPEPLRKELVDELMAARRAVKAAGDVDEVAEARARVDAAKRALGERGPAWWEPVRPGGRTERLESAVLALARHRFPKTICPSDAARIAGGEQWRRLMPDARSAARGLARAGTVELLQKGQPIDPERDWTGPIRIRFVRDHPGPEG